MRRASNLFGRVETLLVVVLMFLAVLFVAGAPPAGVSAGLGVFLGCWVLACAASTGGFQRLGRYRYGVLIMSAGVLAMTVTTLLTATGSARAGAHLIMYVGAPLWTVGAATVGGTFLLEFLREARELWRSR